MSDSQNNTDLVQILVVEDSSDDARMTLRTLSKLSPSISVKVATDGAQALDLLLGPAAYYPELIFLDVKLPKVHGFEVLRRLKLNASTCQIPVVVLSSSDEPRDIAKAKDLGASEYVRKPMEPGEYTHIICEVAEKYVRSGLCKL